MFEGLKFFYYQKGLIEGAYLIFAKSTADSIVIQCRTGEEERLLLQSLLCV